MIPPKSYTPDATGPLTGVRILDLSRLFAGNVLTGMLADFGADVIKVEPPEGDTLRHWKVAGVATHWQVYGRNKRSLCLNLREEGAIALLRQLAEGADMLIESFRPGILEEMGLGPKILHAINPRLCIGRISGWGQTGPYATRPGFGTTIEGFSGFAAMNGFADSAPVLPPMYLADGIAGLHGAAAMMIALRNVELNDGKGQIIDLSLLEPLMALLGPQAANYRLTGKAKPRSGSRSGNSAPRNIYRCSDGLYLTLSASTQKMAERLFRTIGGGLAEDPRFHTNADRLRHVEQLDEIVGEFIGRRTLADNLTLFNDAAITVGPINTIAEILTDPHVNARETFVELPAPEGECVPMMNIIPAMDETPGSFRLTAPELGADSQTILAEIGITEETFRDLIKAGIVIESDGPSP